MTAGVKQLLAEVLPDRRIADIGEVHGGRISDVFGVRFVDGSEPAIVKVYPSEERWKRAKELAIYELLDRHGVAPIPEIWHSEAASVHLDARPCTVMTMMEGVPLSTVAGAMAEHELFDVYRQMGELLASVHAISMDAFGYITTEILDPATTNAEYILGSVERHLEQYATRGGSQSLWSALRRHFADHASLFDLCKRPALCHNDFHENNVLVTRRDGSRWSISGLIDMETAIAADPVSDVAKTDWFAIRGSRTKVDGLIAGLGGESALGPSLPERLALYRQYHELEMWGFFDHIGSASERDEMTAELRKAVTRGGIRLARPSSARRSR